MSTKQAYKSGVRVRVTQTLPRPLAGGALGGALPSTAIEGTVVGYEQSKTGSWFAHSKDDRLWLDRMILRRDDGEVVYLNLDQYSRVEPVS